MGQRGLMSCSRWPALWRRTPRLVASGQCRWRNLKKPVRCSDWMCSQECRKRRQPCGLTAAAHWLKLVRATILGGDLSAKRPVDGGRRYSHLATAAPQPKRSTQAQADPLAKRPETLYDNYERTLANVATTVCATSGREASGHCGHVFLRRSPKPQAPSVVGRTLHAC